MSGVRIPPSLLTGFLPRDGFVTRLSFWDNPSFSQKMCLLIANEQELCWSRIQLGIASISCLAFVHVNAKHMRFSLKQFLMSIVFAGVAFGLISAKVQNYRNASRRSG